MASDGFGDAILAWLSSKVDSLNAETRQAVSDIGEEVAEDTRQYIRTRGTAKSGKQGRIETGAMLDSVDFQVTEDSEDVFEVRAGYNDAPFYTVFQELGTSRIEAMYALSDAADEAERKLERAISKAVRGS